MKKKLGLIAVCVLLISVMAVMFAGCSSEKPRTGEVEKATSVEARSDGFLRVLQLTDLHLTKGYKASKKDKETFRWIREAVEYARPDVVSVTGDAVAGLAGNHGRDNALIQLAEFFEEKEIPWMYVFGNHDGEWSYKTKTQVGKTGGLEGREELYELLKGYKYSLMQKGNDSVAGIGNYAIDVVKYRTAEEKKNNVAVKSTGHMLINFDTHGKKYVEENGELKDVGYIGLDQTQVDWYKKTVLEKTVELGYTPVSSLFMHVPIVEYRDAWRESVHIGGFPEYNLERDPCAPADNNNIGMWQVITELGSTKFMTAGHDHDFNWLRKYGEGGNQAYMLYGRVSGINAWKRRTPVGATVIDINVNTTVDCSLENIYKISVIEPTFAYSSSDELEDFHKSNK